MTRENSVRVQNPLVLFLSQILNANANKNLDSFTGRKERKKEMKKSRKRGRVNYREKLQIMVLRLE